MMQNHIEIAGIQMLESVNKLQQTRDLVKLQSFIYIIDDVKLIETI